MENNNQNSRVAGFSTDDIKNWILQNIEISILTGIFLFTLLLGVVYQPWEGEGDTLETAFPDIFESAEGKGVGMITPFMTILFKGFLDALNCATGVMTERINDGNSFVLLMLLSSSYFVFSVIIGIMVRNHLLKDKDFTQNKITNSIASWLFDNIWLTFTSYFWWFIGGIIGNHPKGATIIMLLILIGAFAYVIAGILAFLGYALVLYGGCYLILNIVMHIPAILFPVRLAVMIGLALVIRILIDSIVDKVFSFIELKDLFSDEIN